MKFFVQFSEGFQNHLRMEHHEGHDIISQVGHALRHAQRDTPIRNTNLDDILKQ